MILEIGRNTVNIKTIAGISDVMDYYAGRDNTRPFFYIFFTGGRIIKIVWVPESVEIYHSVTKYTDGDVDFYTNEPLDSVQKRIKDALKN